MLTARSKSTVLFNGTSPDRLHAILCQSLRICSGNSLQRHSALHGNGIYMAKEPRLVCGYANTVSAIMKDAEWKGSTFSKTRVLLGVELAGSSKSKGVSGIPVITDAKRLMTTLHSSQETSVGVGKSSGTCNQVL